MSRLSRILTGTFFVLIFLLVFITLIEIILLRDYRITAHVPCDPTMEICFIEECLPEEDESCNEVPEEERISYYKVIHKHADNYVECDPEDESCANYICYEGELDCEMETCDPLNMEMACVTPEQYNLEHSLGEENTSDELLIEEGEQGEEGVGEGAAEEAVVEEGTVEDATDSVEVVGSTESEKDTQNETE